MNNAYPVITDKPHAKLQSSNNGENGNSKQVWYESKDIFHIIAENTSDLIMHFQHKSIHQLVYVSPSCSRVTGYTPEEFYADPELAIKLVHPDDRKLVNDFLRMDNTNAHEPFILRWIHKDGRIIWIEQTQTIIRNELGEPVDIYYIARDITERKQAEKALQDSQKFNASLLEHAPHATVVINPDTSIRYVNPAWEQVNGWTQAEVAGMKAPYPWWPEEYKETFADGFKEAMKLDSGKGEVIAQKKNGELYWIDMTWSSVTNNGELEYLLINSVDITERIKAQTALKESEEKYRSIFGSANDIILLIDDKGKILDVNSKMNDITGFTREELVGNNVLSLTQIITASSLARVRETFKNRMLGASVPPYEIEIIKKDGQTAQFEVNARALRMGDKITGDLAILRDITERNNMEKALRESEEKFSKAFHASPEMMAIVNGKDGKYIEINDSFSKCLGYTREELIGHKAEEFNLWVNREESDKMARLMNEQGQIRHEEYNFRTKSGEIRTWLCSADTINIGGNPCMLAVATDITERKQAEEKQQAIINTALDGFWVCNIEGKFLEVNDSYCKMTGYTREELLKMSIQDIEAVESPGQTAQRIKKIGEQGSDRFETQHKRKDGKIIDIEISVNYSNIGEGQMFVFVRDITERKRADKALANEAIRKRILIEQSRDGIVILDENGKVYETNRRFAEMLGYSVEEVLHLNVWDWEYQYPHEQVVEMIRTVDENGDHFETRHRRKDGSVYDVEISTNGATFAGQKLIFCVCRDITDRKQAQEALRESEEKFSKAFHSSPISISISRLGDGKLIEVNESFLRDKGYTREEVIGHRSTELDIWTNPGTRERIVRTLKSGGRVFNEQSQFRTKEGYIRTGLMSAEIISIGNEPCMLVMDIDITQQKLAQERIRLLGSVTQQISDSTIVTDRNFKITYMNKAAQDLFGYSAEEALGKGLDLFNAEPVPKKIIRNIFQTVASGKVWSATVPKRRKDGNIITCESRVSPLYDENGQVSSFIDVQRDVTEQKQMEVKLQEHKQLIESILAAMPEGVLVIDGNDRIILANEAFYKIFHRSKRTTVNKLLSETVHIDQLVNLYNAVKRGKYDDNNLEFRYRVQDLEKIITCAVVKMDGECTLLTFIDISRDREEEEKLYLTDRLASIGEMAAGLAHELNNPLTGIMALSQLLVDSDISGECKEDLESIHSEAKRAASIVKNVLLFARNNTYENGQASVNEVVRDVLRLREYEEKVSNIQVVINLEDNLPDITIDKYQLQQVFLNIILNAEAAIKETKRPGILTVTTERVNNHVNISFKDNGCGIKKNIMPRIFDPFFTTKDIGKGTGLGLSICYSIIVKHGGKISVRSQINEGSTFTIKIPVIA
jgi:PAS domain S-box-containing protein